MIEENSIQFNLNLNMEFSDSEPYDFPIGDLLDSDCEDNTVSNSGKVKPQEDVDFKREAKVTKAKKRKKEETKKIVMRRRVKVRADVMREGRKSEKWKINEQNIDWNRMIDGDQKKDVPEKKRKFSNEAHLILVVLRSLYVVLFVVFKSSQSYLFCHSIISIMKKNIATKRHKPSLLFRSLAISTCLIFITG